MDLLGDAQQVRCPARSWPRPPSRIAWTEVELIAATVSWSLSQKVRSRYLPPGQSGVGPALPTLRGPGRSLKEYAETLWKWGGGTSHSESVVLRHPHPPHPHPRANLPPPRPLALTLDGAEAPAPVLGRSPGWWRTTGAHPRGRCWCSRNHWLSYLKGWCMASWVELPGWYRPLQEREPGLWHLDPERLPSPPSPQGKSPTAPGAG